MGYGVIGIRSNQRFLVSTLTHRDTLFADEDPEKLYRPGLFDAIKDKGWPGVMDYRVLGAVLLVAMAVLYYAFR